MCLQSIFRVFTPVPRAVYSWLDLTLRTPYANKDFVFFYTNKECLFMFNVCPINKKAELFWICCFRFQGSRGTFSTGVTQYVHMQHRPPLNAKTGLQSVLGVFTPALTAVHLWLYLTSPLYMQIKNKDVVLRANKAWIVMLNTCRINRKA